MINTLPTPDPTTLVKSLPAPAALDGCSRFFLVDLAREVQRLEQDAQHGWMDAADVYNTRSYYDSEQDYESVLAFHEGEARRAETASLFLRGLAADAIGWPDSDTLPTSAEIVCYFQDEEPF